MKLELLILVVCLITTFTSCSAPTTKNSPTPSPKPSASPTPAPTEVDVSAKNGDYEGKGKVTKVDLKAVSVEMDHEEIKGLMPAMRMEFYVSDKKFLDGIKVGDNVEFTLRYKDGQETVVKLKKAK